MYKWVNFIILFALSSNFVWGQNSTRDLLLEAITKEFQIIFSEEFTNEDSIDLSKKFADAEQFLIGELNKMVLVDSSTFHEKKKEELIKLENSNGTAELKIRIEETYLLLSASKVWSSDSLFIRLLSSYVGQDTDFKEFQKLESIAYYKSWLYGMLIERFGKETSSYKYNNALIYYKQVLLNIDKPFVSLKHETQLHSKLIKWAQLATEDKSSTITYSELIIQINKHRAVPATEALHLNYSNELFCLIEKYYLDALEISPKDAMLSYSLGIFYYNVAVDLHSSKGQKNTEKSEELREKAMPLLNVK